MQLVTKTSQTIPSSAACRSAVAPSWVATIWRRILVGCWKEHQCRQRRKAEPAVSKRSARCGDSTRVLFCRGQIFQGESVSSWSRGVRSAMAKYSSTQPTPSFTCKYIYTFTFSAASTCRPFTVTHPPEVLYNVTHQVSDSDFSASHLSSFFVVFVSTNADFLTDGDWIKWLKVWGYTPYTIAQLTSLLFIWDVGWVKFQNIRLT